MKKPITGEVGGTSGLDGAREGRGERAFWTGIARGQGVIMSASQFQWRLQEYLPLEDLDLIRLTS